MHKHIENNLVVLPFHLPWFWSADYANQTAYELAERTAVLCYLWADTLYWKSFLKAKKPVRLFEEYSPNLYTYKPFYFIPFRRFLIIEKLNKKLNIFILKLLAYRLKKKFVKNKIILWHLFPIPELLRNPFGERSNSIYDCADFFAGTAKNEAEAKVINKNEKVLTKSVDTVVANSIVLQKHLLKYRKDVHLVPQGFRIKDFEDKKNYSAPKLKAKHPIIGFAGAVNHRINYNILNPLAKNHPEWSFVIWGPVLDKERVSPAVWKKMDELLSLKNVSTGFLEDRTKLPGIFKQFDITIIPYDIKQDFNKYCYPMKLFEFFHLGIPVVSTEVVELKRFPDLVKIGSNYKAFEKIIKGILKNKWSKKNIEKEKRLARENSWENKITSILSSADFLD